MKLGPRILDLRECLLSTKLIDMKIDRNVVDADKERDLHAYVGRDISFCDIAIEQQCYKHLCVKVQGKNC